MRGERGITLVALVVTIIVLLILAGITITYVLADDGIFKKAQEAEYASIKGSILDYASAAQATFLINSYQTTYADQDAADEAAMDAINANFPASFKTTAIANTSITGDMTNRYIDGVCVVTVKNNTYTVTFTDGVPTVADPEAVVSGT